MKAQFNTKELLATLTKVMKAIPAKCFIPVLENFILTARDNVFAVTGSDTETTIISCIPSDEEKGNAVAETGVAFVPARFLVEIIRQISDERLILEQHGEGPLTVRWSNGRSEIPCMKGDDYPQVYKSIADGTEMTFPSKELQDAVSDTLYACFNDNSLRPALCGILFDASPEEINLVATDSHRLVIREMKGCTTSRADSFILASKNAPLISLACGECETVKVAYEQGRAIFSCGDTTVQVKTIEGKYPKYRLAIPTVNGNLLVTDRKHLLSVIRRVTVCASKSSNLVKLVFTPDITGATMEISAEDHGYSVAAKETFETDYTGEKLAIGFNSNFITEILGKLDCENVRIAFSDSRRAALITPQTEEGEEPDTRVVLMPIAIG